MSLLSFAGILEVSRRMIVFAHLLNDASGSPRVLLATISALRANPGGVALFIGSDGNGLLSDSGVPIKKYWYKRTPHRIFTLFTYLSSQVFLFLRLLFDASIPKNAVIYVNTLLPFGAALYGRLTGRKVVYHIHEMSIQPRVLQRFLTSAVRWTSRLNIYVSDTHMAALPVEGIAARRVYNALDSSYMHAAKTSTYQHQREGVFTVLMVASLRDYKGVPEFVKLAQAMQDHLVLRFELLVNDSQMDIDRFFSGHNVQPSNLTVFPCAADTTPFFSRASLVVNLTRVDMCVETFGMTLLEAMAFGIPVIAPPVGGPAELVTDGREGYLLDSRNHGDLCKQVLNLMRDEQLCSRFSEAGRARAAMFSRQVFEQSLKDIVASVSSGVRAEF
ncbi:glycosyltransferase family 4 protein [Massilia varians]|uniref:glycosyltransferase family 4 protein n=1 Tax=Massilia varians TaxID=457921 RepID=UPI0025571230|nr:glycosyltransferase family 4 protein [Massilia varians]MDK6079266.1 glycosyltransferase family 4 protein [Massilia varians]